MRWRNTNAGAWYVQAIESAYMETASALTNLGDYNTTQTATFNSFCRYVVYTNEKNV